MASDFADDELLIIADREDIAEVRYVISASGTSTFHPIADIPYLCTISDHFPVRHDRGSTPVMSKLCKPWAIGQGKHCPPRRFALGEPIFV
jgi:hypothetical protein